MFEIQLLENLRWNFFDILFKSPLIKQVSTFQVKTLFVDVSWPPIFYTQFAKNRLLKSMQQLT